MESIQDFQGLQYPFSDNPVSRKAYDDNNRQYASSTHQLDHDMFPGLIALPRGDEDIIRAVEYAVARQCSIAVMSGGHQYSGACSTGKKNIQLNLKSTYKVRAKDLVVLGPLAPPSQDKSPLVYASVSWSLGEFNDFLKQNGLFVPHGQCTDVRVGGHVQTGGYGQLGRSFGLLGDHVWGIRLINWEARVQEVTQESDPDLFNAILGGSPGNFGIITHYTIKAHRDVDHEFIDEAGETTKPHGLKGLWLYSRSTLKKLLHEIAVMSSDVEAPRNFDLCVSVLSSSFPIFKLMPELEGNVANILERIADLIGVNGDTKWPACIVLYAQWVPMSPDDKFDDRVDAWFQKFRNLNHLLSDWVLHVGEFEKPMSEMTGEWLFRRPREFDNPYVKRTYATKSTDLAKTDWVDRVADRINMVISPLGGHLDLWENCYLSVQIQNFGGNHSQFYQNGNNGTSYSWRDSTVIQTHDCFHVDSIKGKKLAENYQAENDKIMVGESSPFSKQDRRVLWGSYGDWEMDQCWPFYYEDKAKYEKIGRARYKADPKGTFTANPFSVKAVKD